MPRVRFLLVLALGFVASLRAQVPPILPPSAEDETWFGLHPTPGTPPEFVYPFDGRAPQIAAVLHNHHETISPAIMVSAVRVNGTLLDPSVEISSAAPMTIPEFEYALPSLSAAGVYDGRFGPPPAVGESKTYKFDFTFALAPGVPPPNTREPLTVTLSQDVKFTNLGDNPTLSGPNTYGGVLRVANLPAGTSVTNARVEVATPYSPWFNIPLNPVTTNGSTTAYTFSQALPLRNDWHVRFSADGYESRLVWLGFYTAPAPSLDLTLAPAAAPEVDYRRLTTIATPTGAWRTVVAESGGTFVVFPGQQTWKQAATDAEARALRTAGRIAKYRFDGTKVWEHAPGWETWGGDMTTDGRYVAYVLTPLVRSFYTPAENKLVLLDGATGTPIWAKSAAPTDATIGRKLDSVEVHFSPDARWLAVGSLGTGQVTLVDRATGNFAWSVPSAAFGFGQIQKLVFSPDSAFLYCGSSDGCLRKLRVSDGAVQWRNFVYGAPQLTGLNLTADGAWIVVGSRNAYTSVLRTADGFLQWQGPTQSLDTTLAPDTRHVATSGQIFQTIEGTVRGLIKGTGITRFTPDGRSVVQLGRDFRLYDLGGKLLKTFEDSGLATTATDEPRWAHLTRDGRYAIVVARDLPNPPQAGIAIYERRAASASVTAPRISAQPLAQAITTGTATTLGVSATGTAPLAYRWQRNGVDLAGAESATLVIPRAGAADAGDYTAIVSNAAGSVTSAIAPVEIVASDATNPARIANLSVRASVSSTPLIVGFAVGGPATSGTKPLLIRGVGPALAVFNVPNTLRDPRITLFSGTNNLLANDNWAGDGQITSLAAQVGAFPFADRASADAAMVVTSVGGSFTVHLAGADAAAGTGLAEIYDASAGFVASTPRLVNISARADTGGGNALIAGFVIAGPASKTLLVRGIGPTLAQFGVSGALADPQVTIFRGETIVATNDNWYDAPNALRITVAATDVGAFALATTSRDAALLISLPPGSYTAQVAPVTTGSGAALIEIYEVP